MNFPNFETYISSFETYVSKLGLNCPIGRFDILTCRDKNLDAGSTGLVCQVYSQLSTERRHLTEYIMKFRTSVLNLSLSSVIKVELFFFRRTILGKRASVV